MSAPRDVVEEEEEEECVGKGGERGLVAGPGLGGVALTGP